MAKTRPTKRTNAVLTYPPHWFSPEDLLTFVELPNFSARWDGFGLTDGDMNCLQALIMVNPKGPPVIEGTGGLRKMRCGRNNKGSSSGFRVCYVYFEDFATVLMVLIYAKNEQDDSPAKSKRAISRLIKDIQEELERRPYRIRLPEQGQQREEEQ